MADDNYFDADAYAREQEAAFRAAVLGANQNGVSPLPDVAPAASPAPAPSVLDSLAAARAQNAAREADQAKRFRDLVLPPAQRALTVTAGALPFDKSLPFAGVVPPREGDLPARATEEAHARQQAVANELALTNAPKPMYEGVQPAEGLTRPIITAGPTLQEQARKAVAAGAGVGGGIDGGLLAAWRRAQQGQLDKLGEGADLQRELGQDKAGAQLQMSELRAAQALQMQRDAEDQQRIEADANARHEEFLAQSQKMADAIAAEKVDPARFLHNADAKTQILIGLGSAIGGVDAAANGGPNKYLERLDAIVDRDFKGQLANLDNQRGALAARNTVFGQILAQTQDRRLADLQGRDLMYTAMKTKLLADADRLGIPEILTQAQIAANEIENKQAALREQIAAQSYKSAVAAAQAAQSAARAAEERQWQHTIEMMKLNQEQQKIDKMGGEGKAKDVGERSVVLDGKDALAVNKEAAQKWNEYNHGREVFNLALQKLIKARDAGDVGAYDAARAQLIEEYPKLLGYTRAPTEGQISHTVGPNAIPEYNHWYKHAQYGPAGAVTYKVAQGRGQEKIDFLKETLATSDKAMRENTFGAEAGKPKMPASVVKVEPTR